MTLSQIELKQKIESREAILGIIGLGYVGLPVACMFAQAGFRVTGVDIKAERVAMINTGCSPIEGNEPGLAELLADVIGKGSFRATTDITQLSQADIILIDVETPVDDQHKPQFLALKTACSSLGRVMKNGALVIVESTIAPGTIDRVVRPLLENASGLRANEGFYLGACPERVMPGKLLSNLRSLSRVCGGSTPETAKTMVALYSTIVEAELDATDPVTAELVKTTENAYRDVQIAFANEVALICEAVGADVWRVRELVNKSPFRQMHLPGAGVGGHCIPKDPWLLAHSVQDEVDLQLIPTARTVNDSMPVHIGELTRSALEENGLSLPESRILILGYAYLEDSDDTRNSPSEGLLEWLIEQKADVRVHDPWVGDYQGDLYALAKGCDAVVLMVAHREYKDLSLPDLGEALHHRILVDGRGVFVPVRAVEAGFIYRGIGQGKGSNKA